VAEDGVVLVDEPLDVAVQPHDRETLWEHQPERPERPDGRLDPGLQRRSDEDRLVGQLGHRVGVGRARVRPCRCREDAAFVGVAAEGDRPLVHLVERGLVCGVQQGVRRAHIPDAELGCAALFRSVILAAPQPHLRAGRRSWVLRQMEGVPGVLDDDADEGIGLDDLAAHPEPHGGEPRRVGAGHQEPRRDQVLVVLLFGDGGHLLEGAVHVLKQGVEVGSVHGQGALVELRVGQERRERVAPQGGRTRSTIGESV
jgi:hypothetical protein